MKSSLRASSGFNTSTVMSMISSCVLAPLNPLAMDTSSSGSGSFAFSNISQDIMVKHTINTERESNKVLSQFSGKFCHNDKVLYNYIIIIITQSYSAVAILAAAAVFMTLITIIITTLAASIYCKIIIIKSIMS